VIDPSSLAFCFDDVNDSVMRVEFHVQEILLKVKYESCLWSGDVTIFDE
jgi:hypothetical protein